MRELFFFLFLSFSLSAELRIKAEEVDYSDDRVTLNGEVVIDHRMGKMSSETAYYTQPGGGEEGGLLYLQKEVHINLPNGASLDCSRAEFDRRGRTGLFFGEDKLLLYSSQAFSQAGNQAPLTIEAKKLRVRVGEAAIEELEAEEDVHIRYDNEVSGRTDWLWYEPRVGEDKAGGIFHMTPLEGRQSHIVTDSGDRIHAQEIHLDVGREKIIFDQADGEIFFNSGEQVFFRSDEVAWEDQRQRLTMTGRVMVHQQGVGKLKSNESIRLDMVREEGRRRLRVMESRGKTTLSFVDDGNHELHTIVCFGSAVVDHYLFKTTMKSPRVNGVVPRDKRVVFRDRMGHVTANDVELLYYPQNGQPRLSKITLIGDVYLLNLAPFDPADSGPVRQYALADRAEYDPTTLQVTLTAEAPNRVLYFDEINRIQVSAPEIEAWRNGVSGEESIRGKGDVRFSLAEGELDQMKPLFRMQHALKGQRELLR
jgi:hypothetical protein